jgi:hypothetical protein
MGFQLVGTRTVMVAISFAMLRAGVETSGAYGLLLTPIRVESIPIGGGTSTSINGTPVHP